MRVFGWAGAVAFGLAISGSAAGAYTLAQAASPAETPPASFSGDVYIDSRGCAYVRGKIGSNVSWVPWVGSDRKTVMCGMTPTASTGRVVAAPPPPPPPPPPLPPASLPASLPAPANVTATTVANPTPAAAAASAPAPTPTRLAAAAPKPVAASVPAPTVSRTVTVSCPTDGTKVRVRIGGGTIGVRCMPGQTRPASFIVKGTDGTRTRMVVHPVAPKAPRALAAASGSGTNAGLHAGDVLAGGRVVIAGPGSRAGSFAPLKITVPAPVSRAVAPSPRVTMPAGYKSAWKDGRLNPDRGPRSATGDAQMATLLDVRHLPMRTLDKPASGTVISTSNRPAAATAPGATAPAAQTYRFVQVGLFRADANASRALGTLGQLGLKGQVVRTASGANLVVAGPFDDARALASALASVRGAFPDAFARN